MTRALPAYLPAFVWAALLLLVGSVPDLHGPAIDFPLDKVAHFFMYGVLGALAALGWRRAGRRPAWPWVLLGALLIGAADELHQRGVSGRSADVLDWVADLAGIVSMFVPGLRVAAMRGDEGGEVR
ncbi:MAG TPA: VanZ family protein [Longimicrobiales bacterium]